MKDLLVIIVVCGLACIAMLAWHDAEAEVKDETQVIYDKAINFLTHGEKKKGCKLLQQALKSTDDQTTIDAIYTIGIRSCNWTIDPNATYASSPKE